MLADRLATVDLYDFFMIGNLLIMKTLVVAKRPLLQQPPGSSFGIRYLVLLFALGTVHHHGPCGKGGGGEIDPLPSDLPRQQRLHPLLRRFPRNGAFLPA